MVEKDWTVEQVMAAQQQVWDAGVRDDGRGPMAQWDGLRTLDRLERQLAAGDEGALLEAIAVCARHALVIPEWAACAFLEAWRRVIHFETDSWDVAFGRPHPRGMHLARAQQRWLLRYQVWNRIHDLRTSSDKIGLGDELFDQVGEEFGIHKTLCSQLYYEGEASLPPKS
jgi:hypothetical protein